MAVREKAPAAAAAAAGTQGTWTQMWEDGGKEGGQRGGCAVGRAPVLRTAGLRVAWMKQKEDHSRLEENREHQVS